MKNYLVKKAFSDDNGSHSVGSKVELAQNRATKLFSLGIVGAEIVDSKTLQNLESGSKSVEGNLTGLEDVKALLSTASGEIEGLKNDLLGKDEEIETLKSEHSEALRIKNEEIEALKSEQAPVDPSITIEKLKECTSINDVRELVKVAETPSSENEE